MVQAEVVWTEEALLDLESIRVYIRQFDPTAAERMARRLGGAGDSLCSFPKRGRPAGSEWRELVTVPPYVLRYRVEAGRVYITSVLHGARLRS